jgi:antitoxin FitA
MAQVLVRDVDERVVHALKVRAAIHGRSLEQELREVLTAAARSTGPERSAIAAEIRSLTVRATDDSTAIVRADRDSR